MSIIIKSGSTSDLADVNSSKELKVALSSGVTADTELPAAAALADGAANPTPPTVGADNQVFNGTTWDRAKSATAAAATTGTGVPAAGALGFDGTNYQRVKTDTGGITAVNVQGAVPITDNNGSLTVDGSVSITGTATVSGTVTADTELPAAAALADTTTNPTTSIVGAANEVFNGTTWDRAKSASAASATTGTGLPGAGVLGFDGTNYQRLKTDTSGQPAVNVQNFPATQPVSLASPVPVTDNSGSLTVDDGGGSLTVDGAVTVSGTATVSGTVTADTELPAAAALADATANPTTPIVAAAGAVFNGTTWDRAKSATAASATTGTGLPGVGALGFDGTNYQRVKTDTTGIVATSVTGTPNVAVTNTPSVTVSGTATVSGTVTADTEMPAAAALADATTNPTTPIVAAANEVFNGTTWDRARSATSAAGTTGTGVPAAGMLGFDGTNWQRAKTGTSGDQVMSITNPTAAVAGIYAGLTSYGVLRTSTEPHALFNDPFDGALDTTVRWATTGSTVVPTVSGSRATVAAGASLNAATALSSQPTFVGQGINFLAAGWVAQFENINSTAGTLFYLNSHRFMGFGTVAGTWTPAYTASATTGPLLDAIGFEIDTDGKMYPVIYNNGVRTRPALSLGGTDIATGNGTGTGSTFGGLKALADGNLNQFGLAIRADVIFWYCDSLDLPIASLKYSASTFTMPNVTTLPLRFHAINGAVSAPSGTMNLAVSAAGVADTGSNHSQIADGTYPWRKAQVGKSGGLSVRGASVTGTTGAIAAAGTGTVGPVDVSEAGNVTFTIKNTTAASAWAGAPVVVFEQSDDSVSWSPLAVVRSDTNACNTTFTLGAGSANGELMFDAGMEGVNYVRCRVTTGPSTNGFTVVIQPGGMPFSPVVTTMASNPGSATSNGPTSVASSASDTLILAANGNRKGAAVYNDSTAVLYLSLGTSAASTTVFTIKMAAAGYYEVPFSYTGQIRGIWATANGSARITEIVP